MQRVFVCVCVCAREKRKSVLKLSSPKCVNKLLLASALLVNLKLERKRIECMRMKVNGVDLNSDKSNIC